MPLIVRASSVPDIGAEQRIAAAMLNMELGVRAYAATSAGLELQPGPHEPWPLVTMPAATTHGRGCRVQYKPAVGVIYYSGDTGARSRIQLAGRLSAAIESVGSLHLQSARLVGATPVSMLRIAHPEAFSTVVTGPRRPFAKPLAAVGEDMRPARLIQVTPDDELDAPPHFSARAVFTWLMMPLSALISISVRASIGRTNAAIANALLAAIVYDESGLLTFADGAEPELVLAPHDCAGALAPEPEQPFPVKVTAETVFGIVTGSRQTALGTNYVLRAVLGERARLIYCGDYSVLMARKSLQDANARALASLPAVAWDAEKTAGCGAQARGSSCVNCRAPVGGAAVAVSGARRPRELDVRERRQPGGASADMLSEGDLLASAAPGAPTTALICLDCWHAIENPSTTFAILKATVGRVIVPWTQAEAARALGARALAAILEHPVVPLTAGAFLIDCGSSGGPRVVLAGATLGPWPALDHPTMMRDCLLIPGINLVTDRR